jgi:hypothetical protein
MRRRKGGDMRRSIIMAGIVLAAALISGCSSRTSTTGGTSDHVVDVTQGYTRLRNVEPKDIRYVVAQLAESKHWEHVTNKESGSYNPTTKDDFVRHIDVYRDSDGHDIRIEWVWEKGQDVVVLVSADPPVREWVSKAVGVNVLRRQQGMSPLAY